jgi:hypothetical protein
VGLSVGAPVGSIEMVGADDGAEEIVGLDESVG